MVDVVVLLLFLLMLLVPCGLATNALMRKKRVASFRRTRGGSTAVGI